MRSKRKLKISIGDPKIKKVKKPKLSTLKKKLWKIFSEWTRRSNADSKGICKCYTCPKEFPWKQIQAGHYISRIYLGTFVHEKNVKCQCAGCNLFKRGAPDEFAFHLVQEYGSGILEELNTAKHQTIKPDIEYYQNLIEIYQQKLEDLK